MLWLIIFSLRGNLSFSGAATVWTGYFGTYRCVQASGQWQYSLGHDKIPGSPPGISRDCTRFCHTFRRNHPGSARAQGRTIIERTVDWKHGEDAVTHYKVVKEANGHSLVSLRLETGRTHQIRIHMKYLGYPLIGDYLYNPDMEYMTRQALHSHHMEFTHPITGEHMSFTAPLPEDMARVMQE